MAIRLWWIGEGRADEGLMKHACAHLEATYREAVSREVRPGAPADAYDAKRGQHLSGRLLSWLREEDRDGERDGVRVVGVTDRDLFIPILTFVFGEAQLGGRTAIVSLARLQPDSDAKSGEELLRGRVAKECAHELGHAYGLRHCETRSCVMSRSASVIEVDGKGGALCSDCRVRLKDLRRRGPKP